uniref:B box-type domain-containing protein n=1 Tax=Leersia perrieri TaxID=77586 RepID=A0A0D9XXT2_9ORYZ
MKIGCDACSAAEAAVLCCADEAALCRRCDAAVHSANRLAGKHHRLALLLPSSAAAGDHHAPTCDICQEKTGYFFCLDDRALLCRSCDLAVHTATTPHAAAHRRFLITGVRIGDSVANAAADVIASPSISISSNIAGPASISNRHAVTVAAAGGNIGHRSPPAMFRQDDGVAPPPEQQQWPWSDVFADDGGDMEQQCCYTGISEPHSSSLTG